MTEQKEYALVVDDNEDVRQLISDLLEVMGIESRLAANGTEALKIIETKLPKLIILDLMMPGMDGFSTITQLRSKTLSKDVPVILLSAIAERQPHMMNLPGVIAVLRKGSLSLVELGKLVAAYFEVDNPQLQ